MSLQMVITDRELFNEKSKVVKYIVKKIYVKRKKAKAPETPEKSCSNIRKLLSKKELGIEDYY